MAMAEWVDAVLGLPSYLQRRQMCTASAASSLSDRWNGLDDEYADLESAVNGLLWLRPTDLDYLDGAGLRRGKEGYLFWL
jgi:hypothetical protein